MGILDALKKIEKPEPERTDYIHDAVFECAIFRLGLDPKDWMDEPLKEREFILNYLEKEYG